MGFVASTVSCSSATAEQDQPQTVFRQWQLTPPVAAPPAFASVSISHKQPAPQPVFSLAEATPSGVKQQKWRIHKIKPDGKCMFRALAQGMSRHKGDFLTVGNEETEADQLKMAVSDILCGNTGRRKEFSDASYNIEHGGSGDKDFASYCRRIKTDGFWGGAAELSALSQLLKVPIAVYQPDAASAYEPIVVYGQQYSIPKAGGKCRRVVNLLYSSGNHYDLLV